MNKQQEKRVGQFIEHLANERRLSVHTCKNYRRDLFALIEYCDAQGIETWKALTGSDVGAFAAQCHRKGLSPRSIQRRLSAIRSFFRFLGREHIVANNPATDIHAPKARKRLPNTLDADAMARLLDIKGDSPLVTRDRAILELLYSSGLRLAELVSLDLGDIDVNDATVRVTGKGSKTRIVPVGRHALSALDAWAAQRAQFADPGENAVFVSQRGQRISTRAVQARVKYWARRQGIPSRVYPHLFRHSFATHVLESSGDLRGVQEMLGHANISTTQIYTHLDFQHLAQIYDQTHPRARIKDK